MLKIVADTNILISAVITYGNEYEILKLAKLDKIKLIISYDILWEFEEVLKRQKFSFSGEQVKEILEQIESIAEIINPSIKLEVVKEDPDDDKVLEAAVEGKVNYVISGDEHLLKLKKYENVEIINSASFLEIFRKN